MNLNMQRIIRNPGFLVLVLLSGLTACTGPKGPALPGRILTMGQCEDQHVSVLEFKESTQSEQPLWTNIPCYLEETLTGKVKRYPSFVVSANGNYVLLNMPATEGLSGYGIVKFTHR